MAADNINIVEAVTMPDGSRDTISGILQIQGPSLLLAIRGPDDFDVIEYLRSSDVRFSLEGAGRQGELFVAVKSVVDP